jgi:hypothetical protein
MSVSPCGINLSVSQSGNTLTINASQGSNTASATLSPGSYAYSYNWTLKGTTYTGSGTGTF